MSGTPAARSTSRSCSRSSAMPLPVAAESLAALELPAPAPPAAGATATAANELEASEPAAAADVVEADDVAAAEAVALASLLPPASCCRRISLIALTPSSVSHTSGANSATWRPSTLTRPILATTASSSLPCATYFWSGSRRCSRGGLSSADSSDRLSCARIVPAGTAAEAAWATTAVGCTCPRGPVAVTAPLLSAAGIAIAEVGEESDIGAPTLDAACTAATTAADAATADCNPAATDAAAADAAAAACNPAADAAAADASAAALSTATENTDARVAAARSGSGAARLALISSRHVSGMRRLPIAADRAAIRST